MKTATARNNLARPSPGRWNDGLFWSLLVVTLSVYSLHLFSFTVFEGFSTLSSDSFSYLRQALAWSPYSEAAPHVLSTLPEHQRAPGFSWLLAISGGAESTYRAHFVVSVLMLFSIGLGALMAYRSSGLLAGIGLAVAFCLLPGALISSLGILSENLYLLTSMGALVLYDRITRNPGDRLYVVMVLKLALLGCLSLAILTRSAGIALVLAVLLAAPGGARRRKASMVFISLLSLAAWMLWNSFGSPLDIPGEHSYFVSVFTGNDRSFIEGLAVLWHSLQGNISSLVGAWNHYLTLTHGNPLFFVGSFLLLALVMVCASVRAVQLKVDAVYLFGYLAIILLWPFPQGMLRFLHPVVMLLLLQPFLYLGQGSTGKAGRIKTIILSLVVLGLVAGGVSAQLRLNQLKDQAEIQYPGIEHSFEYYESLDRAAAVSLPLLWQETISHMKQSAEVIPQGSTVAAVKHEAFMLLAGRRAVMLTSLVDYHQQLCNFQLQDVDYVFLSLVNSALVPQPSELKEIYSDIAEDVRSLRDASDRPRAYIIKLNMQAYRDEMLRADAACRTVRLH